MTDTIVTCRAQTRSGEQCRTRDGLSGDGLCALHDPTRAAEIASKRRKGAAKDGKAFVSVEDLPCAGRLATLEDCSTWLEWITVQTVTGQLDPAKAREAVKAVMAMRFKLRDELAAEKRIKALEKMLAQRAEGART